MSNPPSYRQLAETTLNQAVQELRALPVGRVRTDELIAHSTKAQAIATIALTQALLHIGDVLREGFTRGYYDVEVD